MYTQPWWTVLFRGPERRGRQEVGTGATSSLVAADICLSPGGWRKQATWKTGRANGCAKALGQGEPGVWEL